jgi:hypothetical protein
MNFSVLGVQACWVPRRAPRLADFERDVDVAAGRVGRRLQIDAEYY